MDASFKPLFRPDDRHWMDQAIEEAELALAEGEFPVGCLLVEGGREIARGRRRGSTRGAELDHAEVVALRALDTSGRQPDWSRVTLYSTMEPCLMCLAAALLSGVRRIVYAYEDVMGGGCGLDLAALPPLYQEMRPEILGGLERDRALGLFARFFQEHHYLQDSLLARHALAEAARIGNGA